jgi:ribonuclease HI
LKEKRLKKVTLYCDGSSLGNPGAGGYAGILEYKNAKKYFSGGENFTTNNRMELRALIEGLKLLKEPCIVEVFSDSRYVVDGVNLWLKNWIKKDFKSVKNTDLWKEFLEVSKEHQVFMIWVQGHSGNLKNEICDKMAKEEALKYKLT